MEVLSLLSSLNVPSVSVYDATTNSNPRTLPLYVMSQILYIFN